MTISIEPSPNATVTPISEARSRVNSTKPAATAESSDALLGNYKRAPGRFTRGEGVYLFDASGKRYLDFVSGIAVNALGHADPGLRAAMHDAADGLIHVSNLYATEPGERLAASLVQHSFASKVFFCNSGAEANEGAFKFARKWGRNQSDAKHEILAVRGAFHGRLFASLAATDRPSYRAPFRPLAPGIGIIERDIEDLSVALNPETVAALILEPVQGEGGVRVLDAGFVREVRALTKERGVALILDEIQCGLGRTGTLFAYEHFGIEPDMLTLAKPIAGGLPMGAVLINEEIAAAIKPGEHGTTFGGGPFIASVANHVFGRLSDPELLTSVAENGAWFGQQLHEIAQRTARIRAVRGLGYMWGIDVMGTASHVVSEAFTAGLLTCTAGEYTVRLLPPLVATRDELQYGLGILEEVL
jgi:acetylornithine/N-succinyldiaminopimelate aminotransferase